MDIHQFFLGNAFDAHTYFGAHVTEQGVVFRTLAPNAAAVDLIWEGGDWGADTHAANPRRRRVRAHRTGSRRRTDVKGTASPRRIPTATSSITATPMASAWSCVRTTLRLSATCPATRSTTRNGWHSVAVTGRNRSTSTRCIWVRGEPIRTTPTAGTPMRRSPRSWWTTSKRQAITISNSCP